MLPSMVWTLFLRQMDVRAKVGRPVAQAAQAGRMIIVKVVAGVGAGLAMANHAKLDKQTETRLARAVVAKRRSEGRTGARASTMAGEASVGALVTEILAAVEAEATQASDT